MRINKLAWVDIDSLCMRLARKIKTSGFSPDIIIGIGRGGWVPARLLSDLLAVDELYAMRVKVYSGRKRGNREPALLQDFPGEISGKRILVIDDVSATGESLELVRKRLSGAKELRTATLHVKPQSKPKPDYYVELTREWMDYPWEKKEIEDEI